jgi:hypothetical protein
MVMFYQPKVITGTHPELVSLMEEIESKKRKRMDTAAAWCRYQQLNYRRQYEGFEYQANVHFIVRSVLSAKSMCAISLEDD